MAAVKAGAGREMAHEAIKEHAVAVALAMRELGTVENDLMARLADDPRIPLDRTALEALLGEPLSFVGAASAQVASFRDAVAELAVAYPDAAAYRPGAIL